MMVRGHALVMAATALALCAICAWAVDALLNPATILAIAAMFTLC
jgi:hypothetical protein